MLLAKQIPVTERLIVALDLPDAAAATALVERLGETVDFYKVGLELFMAGGCFTLLDRLGAAGKKVMIDLKFFDVPRTVAAAVAGLARYPGAFVTVHGNDGILRAAVEAAPGLRILAVTVLTSLDQGDLDDLGFVCDPATLVLSRARRALALGCAGVVSSGLEAPKLRESLGPGFLIVTPGIRPVANREEPPKDDQKRTTDIEEAFHNGADYIVVGRPIVKAPDPLAAARSAQARIAALFDAAAG
ncbi:MAG: orotidine-5'-phosphate decarboxylase [Azospirillum sp.]|nr:orotidine-5'-phosphate decarboxylase [Azospirillum sp.]